MKTWLLYLLWLLTGGDDASDTEDSISSGVDPVPDDAFELDDVECDAFEFEDSEFEDFEGDEGLFH
jgi:hypothetical protein